MIVHTRKDKKYAFLYWKASCTRSFIRGLWLQTELRWQPTLPVKVLALLRQCATSPQPSSAVGTGDPSAAATCIAALRFAAELPRKERQTHAHRPRSKQEALGSVQKGLRISQVLARFFSNTDETSLKNVKSPLSLKNWAIVNTLKKKKNTGWQIQVFE